MNLGKASYLPVTMPELKVRRVACNLSKTSNQGAQAYLSDNKVAYEEAIKDQKERT